MSKPTYVSQNSIHLLETYRVMRALEAAGCCVTVMAGSLLGLVEEGNFLLNDNDADLLVTNKTDEEVREILAGSFGAERVVTGRANVAGMRLAFAKARFLTSSRPTGRYDVDVFTPGTYFGLRYGRSNLHKVLELSSERKWVTIQGLSFPVPVQDYLWCQTEYGADYRQRWYIANPVYDKDDLDLAQLFDVPLFVSVTADPWHRGHTRLMEEANIISADVRLGVTSDKYARSYGKSPPPALARAQVLCPRFPSVEIWDGPLSADDTIGEHTPFFGINTQGEAETYAALHFPGRATYWTKMLEGISSTEIRG